jgi:hypothetical protein
MPAWFQHYDWARRCPGKQLGEPHVNRWVQQQCRAATLKHHQQGTEQCVLCASCAALHRGIKICGLILILPDILHALQDPLLFLRIRASFETPDLPWTLDEPEAVVQFLRSFAAEAFKSRTEVKLASSAGQGGGQETELLEPQQRMTERGKMGRLKKASWGCLSETL